MSRNLVIVIYNVSGKTNIQNEIDSNPQIIETLYYAYVYVNAIRNYLN